MSTLDDAIQAIRMGDREEGRRLLEEMLEADEGNEEIWLWLTATVDTDEDREVCLENVLALNPNNVVAQKSLENLRAGNFNPRDIMQAAIDEEEEEDAESGATFLDEFRRASDEEEDDDLVMPSTMSKSKSKKPAAKKKGAGFKLNPRLIVLAVLALLIICALGGVAAYNLAGGGVEPAATEAPAEPTAPAGGEETVPTAEPAPEETSEVPPTDTPEPTKTPFQLPTPKPTDVPTPTATPVVAPTP